MDIARAQNNFAKRVDKLVLVCYNVYIAKEK
jgi:hypothetical protein